MLIHLNIVHIVHLRHLLEHLLLVILRHLHLGCVVVLLVILLRLLLWHIEFVHLRMRNWGLQWGLRVGLG